MWLRMARCRLLHGRPCLPGCLPGIPGSPSGIGIISGSDKMERWGSRGGGVENPTCLHLRHPLISGDRSLRVAPSCVFAPWPSRARGEASGSCLSDRMTAAVSGTTHRSPACSASPSASGRDRSIQIFGTPWRDGGLIGRRRFGSPIADLISVSVAPFDPGTGLPAVRSSAGRCHRDGCQSESLGRRFASAESVPDFTRSG